MHVEGICQHVLQNCLLRASLKLTPEEIMAACSHLVLGSCRST